MDFINRTVLNNAKPPIDLNNVVFRVMSYESAFYSAPQLKDHQASQILAKSIGDFYMLSKDL